MHFSRLLGAASLLASAAVVNAASQYSIDSDDAIKKSAAQVAWDLLQYYDGNETGKTPGILPGPPPAGDYYWWEAGAMWGALMDYWKATGDESYNTIIMQAMMHQKAPNNDFQDKNFTLSLGNDDQGFWGMTAMLAAELKFPDPPSDQPGWLALAQGVFNTQAAPDRHDTTCGGGLRWQIPLTNQGYGYKNSIANGCFFNLGARLARYTLNETYSKWADTTWNWMEAVGFIDAETYEVYDGAHVAKNCTDINKTQFSYNVGVFAQGAAHMYNYTNGSTVWKERTQKLVDACLKSFFSENSIMVEISCENYGTCTTDMLSFKGYVHRWLTQVARIAPFTAETILPVLKKSAAAAVAQCTGGDTGRACGFKWASGTYDGKTGVGQQMNVLGALSGLLEQNFLSLVSANDGGTSKGNPDAGSNSDTTGDKPVTTAAKAGAGILTFLLVASSCGLFAWMSIGA